MKWLVKQMADETRFYHIFLGALIAYAFFGVIGFATIGTYLPSMATAAFVLFLVGSGLIALVMRVAHNLCYAKVVQWSQESHTK